MPRCDGGRMICGGWQSGVSVRRWTFTTDRVLSLIGAVLVTGCGAGTPDPGPGVDPSPVAGVTPTAGVAAETAVTDGAQDEWQVVRLDEMMVDRSDPEDKRRNPFRFGERPSSPPSEPGGGDEPGPVAPVRGVDLPVPAPRAPSPEGTAEVPLTFIGFVESPGIEGRVVVLTDGEAVFHGRVGDVIDGRYRIVRLGIESVDVEPIDGRGQQTLRLSSGSFSGL